MAKARCPVCNDLVGISVAEKMQDFKSSHWWRIDVHKKPDVKEICEGSGRKV